METLVHKLDQEMVEQASRREGISHPIITLLEEHQSRIAELNAGAPPRPDPNYDGYIKKHYGFLVDAMVEAGEFTLYPQETIAIWSKAVEVLSKSQPHRHIFATALVGAFAIQGMSEPERKQLPRHFVETGQLPDVIAQNRPSLEHLQKRLGQLSESLGAVIGYVFGVDDIQVVTKLVMEAGCRNQKAIADLEILADYHQAHNNTVLALVSENIGAGLEAWNTAISRKLLEKQGNNSG